MFWAIVSRFRGRDSDISFAYTLMLASLIAPAPWLLTEWSRCSFYKFSGYFLLNSLISLSYHVYSQHHLRKFTNFLSIKRAPLAEPTCLSLAIAIRKCLERKHKMLENIEIFLGAMSISGLQTSWKTSFKTSILF